MGRKEEGRRHKQATQSQQMEGIGFVTGTPVTFTASKSETETNGYGKRLRVEKENGCNRGGIYKTQDVVDDGHDQYVFLFYFYF